MLMISIFFKNDSYIDGKLSGGVNQEGVDYYNRLIDHLKANGQYIHAFLSWFFLIKIKILKYF